LIELRAADADLAPLLNITNLPAAYAVMLYRRFEACLQSPWAAQAPRLAVETLAQAGDAAADPHRVAFPPRFLLGNGPPVSSLSVRPLADRSFFT